MGESVVKEPSVQDWYCPAEETELKVRVAGARGSADEAHTGCTRPSISDAV